MRRIALAFVLVVLVAGFALADKGVFFEYEIKLEGSGVPPEMAQMGKMIVRTWLQGDLFKMETNQGSIILRKDKGVVWIIDSDRKQYLEFPFSMFEGMMKSAKQQAETMETQYEYKKTGRKNKIGRWNCYEVVIKFKDPTNPQVEHKSVIWMTKDAELDPKKLAEAFEWDWFGTTKYNKDVLKHSELDGFPVRIITEDHTQQGVVKSIMTLTDFQHKSFPMSTFELPKGYTKIQMPQMPQGMGGGQPMPMPPQGQ